MLRGHRLHCLAFVGWLALLMWPAIAVPVPPPAVAEEPALAVPVADPADGAEALRAQLWTAEATDQIAFWTQFQVIVTAVGSALLLGTIFLTYRATRAAEAQVEVVQDTAKRELRAYMSLAPAGVAFGSKPGQRLIVGVTQKNNGQTPAKEVRMAYHIERLQHPLPHDFPFPETIDCPGTNVVHPGAQFTVTPRTDIILSDLWKDAEEGGFRRVYVFFRLRYADVFGDEQETRACWWFHPQVLHAVSGEISSHDSKLAGTNFEYIDQHNTAT